MSRLIAAKRTIRVARTVAKATYDLSRIPEHRLDLATEIVKDYAQQACIDFDINHIRSGYVPDEGDLLISNHRSYMDGIAIACDTPACFVGKAEIQNMPVIGSVMKRGPVIFIKRGDRDSGKRVRRKIRDTLRKGVSVVNFSEGTTHGGYGMLPFKLGLFQEVFGWNLKIVPVSLRYHVMGARVDFVGDDAFASHFWQLAHHNGFAVEVHFGRPVHCNSYRSPETLMFEVRNRIREHL